MKYSSLESKARLAADGWPALSPVVGEGWGIEAARLHWEVSPDEVLMICHHG